MTKSRFAWSICALLYRRRLTGDKGQGLAEYGLILLLIGIAAVGALTPLGTAIAKPPGFTSLF